MSINEEPQSGDANRRLVLFYNRLLSKLAYAEGFEGDAEPRPAAYSNVTLLDKRDGVVARASK
ncbi:hypothetical protein [Candidatus Tisiphia endosymbiont of Melanophora roralis]|uniref:hypothetical protein n=1 Tax=Candidatus Tisiphia endosymbiont of Melanophora roralis TaxID=3066261 RepID=UPI00312CABEB